jgi:hypothetical protein
VSSSSSASFFFSSFVVLVTPFRRSARTSSAVSCFSDDAAVASSTSDSSLSAPSFGSGASVASGISTGVVGVAACALLPFFLDFFFFLDFWSASVSIGGQGSESLHTSLRHRRHISGRHGCEI